MRARELARALTRVLTRGLGLEVRRRRMVQAPYLMEVHAPGADFRFWIADDLGERWYATADHAHNPELLALRALARAGDRVLEIGCHHGLHTVYLAHVVGPDGVVVAMEADPGNALIAQAQLQLNRLAHAMVEAAAAGAEGGRARISLVDNTISGAGGPDELIEVPVLPGDELDRRHGPVTVLKIDVEGWEAKVLRGCAGILARRPRLALELHGPLLLQAGDRSEEVAALLAPLAYQGMVMLPSLEQIPYQVDQLPALCRAHPKVNLFLTPG